MVKVSSEPNLAHFPRFFSSFRPRERKPLKNVHLSTCLNKWQALCIGEGCSREKSVTSPTHLSTSSTMSAPYQAPNQNQNNHRKLSICKRSHLRLVAFLRIKIKNPICNPIQSHKISHSSNVISGKIDTAFIAERK